MDTPVGALVIVQALGALLGALSAVWGEFAYARAMRDGHIDRAERAHLDSIARGLYFGMTTLLLASLGLVVLAYLAEIPAQPALTPSYWSFVILALLVVGLTWALSRKRISFALGSAAVFTAWWYLTYLAFERLPPLSFGASIALYLIAATIFYALLRLIRHLMISRGRVASGIV